MICWGSLQVGHRREASDSCREAEGAILTRLTQAYLLCPLFLFFAGWLKPVYAVVLTSLLLGALWRMKPASPERRLSKKLVLSMVGISFLWLCLSGVGGVGYQNSDFLKHNAILKALVSHPWPVRLTSVEWMDNIQPALVYYLSFYLPAAAVGKLLGWTAANAALFLWAWLGLILTFFWCARFAGWLVLLFPLLGGWDPLGYLILNRRIPQPGEHIEWWLHGYPTMDSMNHAFQYSSNSALLFWVPQHGLGGWLAAFLLLDEFLHRDHCRFYGVCGLSAAMWSPFAAVGLLPLAVVGGFTRSFRGLVSVANLAVLPSLFVLGTYFSTVYIRLAPQFWGIEDFRRYFPAWLLFIALELSVFIIPLVFSRKNLSRKESTLLWVSALTLAFLPFARMGLYNDLVMRASIPCLLWMWLLVLKQLSTETLAGKLVICAVVLGFCVGGQELWRGLRHYRFGVPEYSSVQRVTDLSDRDVSRQYLGNRDSLFFRYLVR